MHGGIGIDRLTFDFSPVSRTFELPLPAVRVSQDIQKKQEKHLLFSLYHICRSLSNHSNVSWSIPIFAIIPADGTVFDRYFSGSSIMPSS